MTVRGTVINIHHHGATVRLEDGTLATVAAPELATNRPAYVSSLAKRQPLELDVDGSARHRTAAIAGTRATLSRDDAFEARMNEYLKETEAWAPPDQTPPAERHFIRKKRRARVFEARADAT